MELYNRYLLTNTSSFLIVVTLIICILPYLKRNRPLDLFHHTLLRRFFSLYKMDDNHELSICHWFIKFGSFSDLRCIFYLTPCCMSGFKKVGFLSKRNLWHFVFILGRRLVSYCYFLNIEHDKLLINLLLVKDL